MRTRAEVTAEKLRGGFYTPDRLVDLCLERIAGLTRDRTTLRVLEPSVGDGAFIRGLERSSLAATVGRVTAIELSAGEAAKADAALSASPFGGDVRIGSAIEWAVATQEQFDVAVGNPPYVRFQFIDAADRASTTLLARRLDVTFAGVSNLWLPVLLGALGRLCDGGAFAFVIPTECFTGVAAGSLRDWLVRHAGDLRFDLFPVGSFPGALQEVTVLSGRRVEANGGPVACTICEHASGVDTAGAVHRSHHLVAAGRQPWTRYLLSSDHVAALEEASNLASVRRVGELARFEVAAVTGANGFFTVDDATAAGFELGPWTRPLLARIRHAPGLRYTSADHATARDGGARVHLLDFSGERADPSDAAGAARYLQAGTRDELHLRYKCRIREPWYRVPHIRAGELMLSKRSHRFPRMVVNDVGVVTTDTIYRGTPIGELMDRPADLAASFHNSLTLLSAELEGRSFGGGVLELVPSEVARLRVPFVAGFGDELDRLDSIARASPEAGRLVVETDLLLSKADIGLTPDLVHLLADARQSLLQRRLDRGA